MSSFTSTNRTNVTINATINRFASSADVEAALREIARQYGVTLGDLTVTTAPAERVVNVEMTEAQYAAWQASQATSTTPGA
jgi:hypothetical protein